MSELKAGNSEAQRLDKPNALYFAIREQEQVTDRLQVLLHRIRPEASEAEKDGKPTNRSTVSLHELLCDGPRLLANESEQQNHLINTLEELLFDN